MTSDDSVVELDQVGDLLLRRYFTEAIYFGAISIAHEPTALGHLLTGVACLASLEPLAAAQRALDGEPGSNDESDCKMRISPLTAFPQYGLLHLLEALRLDPALLAPAELRDLFDAVADELAYISRRELHGSSPAPRYPTRVAAAAAAVLLRRLTGSDRLLRGIASPTLEIAHEIIDAELARGA